MGLKSANTAEAMHRLTVVCMAFVVVLIVVVKP